MHKEPMEEKLKPGFDVYPHGVKKVNGEVYAVFKLVFAIDGLREGHYIAKEDWDALLTIAESINWSCTKIKVGTTETLEFKHKADGGNCQFQVSNLDGEYVTYPKPNWGKFMHKKKWNDGWSFWVDDKVAFVVAPKLAKSIPIKQYVKESLALDDDGNAYQAAFKGQKEYASSFNARLIIKRKSLINMLPPVVAESRSANSLSLDIKSFFSQVYNEPVAAERRFGLIREIHVKFCDLIGFSDDTEHTLPYNILISYHHGDPQNTISRTSKNFLAYKINKKYYNGNKKMFIGPEDFKDLIVTHYDPYKQTNKGNENQESEKGDQKPHPDGIYLLGLYRHKRNAAGQEDAILGIDDPFDREGEGVEGFNVLLKDGDGPLSSLSLHKKQGTFNEYGKQFAEITSGTLTPKSEVGDGSSAYRNNILFRVLWL
ncbi:MAG: hypothetical protein EOO01_07805 [Chitinophagaceae bacterium]|nr:MAG: hypothetical protein EOO01_07805 [Chitinophagaceae bacterium]